MRQKFRLGLLINPVAGLGGSVALKGSDGVASQAIALGAKPQASHRMAQALDIFVKYADEIEVVAAAGLMGEDLAKSKGFTTQVIDTLNSAQFGETTASDSRHFASAMMTQNIDLLLFAGGDGTARDIYAAVGDSLPVLGVPAGVKIHSGVYGITPVASGMVVKQLLEGELVSLMTADVMDIDEALFRQGKVMAKRYGEMQVPAEPRYIQAVKMGGRESNELVLADIAAEVIEQIEGETVIVGSGSTVAAVMQELSLDNTLLGVDVIAAESLLASDVKANELIDIVTQRRLDSLPVKLMITVIGGQGHILGRGNQQLTPELLKMIGKENILLVATKTKLKALEGRPLIVDSGEPELDQWLSGYYRVITGYRDYVMYQVSSPVAEA